MKHKRILLLAVFLLALAASFFGNAADEPSVPVYDSAPAVIKEYASQSEYLADMDIASEDSKAILYYDKSTANVALLNKEDNSLWLSSPLSIAASDVSSDQKELTLSPVIISYLDTTLKSFELSSFKDCAAYGQIKSKNITNGVSFTLTIGKLTQSEVLPEVMPQARLDSLEEALEKADFSYIKQSYRKVSLKGNNEDQTLLKDYPGLKDGDIYVIRANTAAQIKKKLAEHFAKAGYTREQLLEDEETVYGEAKSKEEESANFTLTLEYILQDGDFTVNVPVESIYYNKDKFKLVNLTVLKYFGAASGDEDGFFLLPDGCGAVSEYKASQTGSGSPFEVNLYGPDAAFQYDASLNSTQPARIPMFGQQKNKSGYIAIMEEGDAQASVRSIVDESENNLRYSHFVCHVRLSAEYIHSEFASHDTYIRANPNPYKGNYRVRYKFLTDASYSGMANAYRDYLVKNKTLTQMSKQDVPALSIELLGAVEAPYNGIFTDSKLYPLTTYAQSAEIAEDLKSAGIENLNLKLSGWANGGMDYTVFSKVKLLSVLGGKKGFDTLVKTANDKNIALYPDVDISFIRRDKAFDGFKLSANAAHQLDNTFSRVYPYNPGSGLGQYTAPHFAVKSNSMLKYANGLLKSYKYPSGGLSIASLGSVLNSDSSKKSGSRTDSLNDYIKIIGQASQKYSLMVDGGNFYTWKNAAVINSLPSTSSGYRNTSFSVPFLQMVLHGYIPYFGDSVNLSPDPLFSVLKAIENGEGLCFTLAKQNTMYLSLSDYQEYNSVSYDFWKSKMLENYSLLNDIQKDTFDQEIISHEYLTPETVKVAYKNGKCVIVNYSANDYVSDEITVKSKTAAKL